MQTSAALDVVPPSGERTRIPITPVPFRIGRGADNHLILRDNRASRSHAAIRSVDTGFVIEDLDSLHGTWVNGRRIAAPAELASGDIVHFGFEDGYRLAFVASDDRMQNLLDRLSAVTAHTSGAGSQFARLRAVLDIARTVQTSVVLDEVLGVLLETALILTGAERAFLLLRSENGLAIRLGRDRKRRPLDTAEFKLPTEIIARALSARHDLLSMTLESAGRDVICVPLVDVSSVSTQKTISISPQSSTLGLIYLEGHDQTVVPDLNLELLHTLALEASTVLENASQVERERQNVLLKRELELTRKIQESLFLANFPNSGWLRAAGSSLPSSQVSGDYFDLRQIDSDDWAAAIANVSGKSISSALLAALLQGALVLGSGLAASLDEVVTRINSFVADRAQGEKYVTLFYATIHSSGRMEWVNAGHCPPCLLKPSGDVWQLQSTGVPLGRWHDAQYKFESLQLKPGDKVIAFSDSISEAQNEPGETFKSQLTPLLKQCAELSAQQSHDRLMDEVRRFQQGTEPRDAMTALVLEYCGRS